MYTEKTKALIGYAVILEIYAKLKFSHHAVHILCTYHCTCKFITLKQMTASFYKC